MMQDEHIAQEDLILYAMQVMQLNGFAAVCLHLDQCSECRHVLAEITKDLALVAMSVDPKPLPEGARQRFIERLPEDASRADRKQL